VTLSPGAFLRVGLLVFLCVVLQLSAVGQIPILGTTANLVPLVVAAIALALVAGFMLVLAPR
jgi:hypothetical protein